MDPFQNNAVFSPSPNTGDIILSPSAPAKKSKKPLVIVLIILVLLAAGAAAWYFLRPGNNGKEEISLGEARNRIVNLTSDYTELIAIYSNISNAFSEENLESNRLAFPVPAGSLESLKTFSTNVANDISLLNTNQLRIKNLNQEQLNTIVAVEGEIAKTSAIIAQNNELLSNYYNAFILPLQNIVTGETKVSACNKTAEQSALMSSDTKNAADAYFVFYCGVVNMVNSKMLDEDVAANQANAAAKLLKSHLIAIEDQSQTIETLQNLKQEIAPNENEE